MYSLEDPLSCLQKQPPEKSTYKEIIATKIISFHEKEMKMKAEDNRLMKYLNVNLFSLRGRHHPALANIITTDEVKKLRPHLKFLTGDYLTYERKYQESGQGDPTCRTCKQESESISHIISQCSAYNSIRDRIFLEFSEVCKFTKNSINFENLKSDESVLTQFILDPTSFNLKNRVNIGDPAVPALFKLSRDLCTAIHAERTRKLRELQ